MAVKTEDVAGKGLAPDPHAGPHRCGFAAAAGQCNYPGWISHNAHGAPPFFCGWHGAEGISASYGEQVVIESLEYVRTGKLPARPKPKPGHAVIEAVRGLRREALRRALATKLYDDLGLKTPERMPREKSMPGAKHVGDLLPPPPKRGAFEDMGDDIPW